MTENPSAPHPQLEDHENVPSASAETRMAYARKIMRNSMDWITATLMEPSSVQKDVKAVMGASVDVKLCEEARKRALQQFRAWTTGQMAKVVEEEKVSIVGVLVVLVALYMCHFQIREKLEELERLTDSTPKDAVGWRPSGDPCADTYAQRRPVYLAHIEKLKETQRWLEQEIHVLDKNTPIWLRRIYACACFRTRNRHWPRRRPG